MKLRKCDVCGKIFDECDKRAETTFYLFTKEDDNGKRNLSKKANGFDICENCTRPFLNILNSKEESLEDANNSWEF